MTTVAAIVDSALDAVSAAITDAVITATVTRTTLGEYNPVTDEQTTTTTTITPRIVYGEMGPTQDIQDMFPGITIAPSDQLIYSDTELVQNDDITIRGTVRKVLGVRDLTGTGGIWSALIR